MSRILATVLSSFALVGVTLLSATAQPPVTKSSQPVKNIVLVHGAFVDGSGWERVHQILEKDGFNVTVVQHPTRSLAEDVAYTKQVLAMQDGPAILVGHSYGGAVISEAGNDPKVAGLVFIAGWVPDSGESVKTLLKDLPPGAPAAPLVPLKDGFLVVDKAKFPASFAADAKPERAAFLADAQVPWGVEAVEGTVREASWRKLPNWYMVTAEDRMIPPALQRNMAKRAGAKVTEIKGSHAVVESKPAEVAALIEQAARTVPSKENARHG